MSLDDEAAIEACMRKHAHEFTDNVKFRIFVGTWNVNNQPINFTHSLTDWLFCDPFPPDIYAIGFQELDLNPALYFTAETPREKQWENACLASLHPKATYVKVESIRLMGILLIVFVKKDLVKYISNVATSSVATGFLKTYGNKGGVAIRFNIHETSICFVNCHLAAHLEECLRRNRDYHEIFARTMFDTFCPPKYIQNHDHIYWLGDLNYRIEDLSAEEIKLRISRDAFQTLLKHDQLIKQMQFGLVLEGFIEPKINFIPTYKYDPNTNDWDSSEKQRPPAWCDRILFCSTSTEIIHYRSHPKLNLSDHKPVSSLFAATVQIVDDNRQVQVRRKILKDWDRKANESRPILEIFKTEIVFSNVELDKPYKETMMIKNIGKVEAFFHFTPKLDSKRYCKEWLAVDPFSDIIEVTEEKNIEFSIYLTDKDLTEKAKLSNKLEDILVLEIKDGKHFFITVTINLQEEKLLIEL